MSCPICGKTSARKTRPFCSKRCADIDLGKWLRGDYAMPSRDPEDMDRAWEETQAQKTREKPH